MQELSKFSITLSILKDTVDALRQNNFEAKISKLQQKLENYIDDNTSESASYEKKEKKPESRKQTVTVGTYNSYGTSGTNEQHERETIQNFALQTDIIGFQEGDPVLVSLLMETHGVFYGSSGNPIFYNKNKFDLVHAEDLEIHDEKEFTKSEKVDGKETDRSTDQRRTSTFIVLRSKETGALTLANNSHFDHRSTRSHAMHFKKINKKLQELENKFNIDAVISLGDYNSAVRTMDNWADEQSDLITGGEDSTNNKTNIDRIFAYGIGHKIEGKPMKRLGRANDADWFPHEMSKKEITITCDANKKEDNKELETKTYPGILFFKDSQFKGDISMIGFGSEDQHFSHKKWNDTTTSIKMSEGSEITLYQHADLSGKEFTYSEDIANVGNDANDMASGYRWKYEK